MKGGGWKIFKEIFAFQVKFTTSCSYILLGPEEV